MPDSSNLSGQHRLSVVMVVREDADGLSQTLHSIESMADEIVVVDTGSSDHTREVARQYASKLVEFEWSDDFSAARNHGLTHATGDWILWLDAGETLSHTDGVALKENLHSGRLNTQSAYVMVVKPPPAPGVIAAEQIARIRLVPHRQGIRFHGRVRESLHETLDNLGIAIDGLRFRILRGPREHDAALKRRRAQRNLQLAELEIAEHGRSPQLVNCLAEAAQTLGDAARAVKLYSECLEIDTTASSERLEAYYGLLTSLDSTPGARSAQLSLCVQALEEFPLDAQLLCAMGGYLQADNHLDLAMRSYETAYAYGRINPLVWHLDEITAIAAVCHSAAQQLQGDEDAALSVLQDALAREGKLPRLCRAVMELHIKHGRRDVALQQVPHLTADVDEQMLLEQAIDGAIFASQQKWVAAFKELQQAFEAGCHDATCLRWLTVTLLATDQFESAGDVLRRWRSLHPADPEPLRILQAYSETGETEPLAASEPSKHRVDTPQHQPSTLRMVHPPTTVRR